MEKIKIGKIVNAVGLKGEVKVYNYSDSEEVYERTPEIYAGDRLLRVQNVRVQKNMVILKQESLHSLLLTACSIYLDMIICQFLKQKKWKNYRRTYLKSLDIQGISNDS